MFWENLKYNKSINERVKLKVDLLDSILNEYSSVIGADFAGYKSHCYRIYNLFHLYSVPANATEEKQLAIATAFHDIGLWTKNTVDYIDPSVEESKLYLKKHPDLLPSAYHDIVFAMIDNHHKIFEYKENAQVEAFRKADWADATLGFRTFGKSFQDIRAVRDFKKFPEAGFYNSLIRFAVHSLLRNPLGLLPMYQLKSRVYQSGDLIEQFLNKFKKKKELAVFLNYRDEAGNTPHLYAVSNNNFKLVEILLEKGANINQQDLESGYTPLHKCLIKGNLRMALLLLEYPNIDFDIRDNEGLNFMDMLNATMKLPKLDQEVIDDQNTLIAKVQNASSSMSLWSWGSNNNYLLGHGDFDTRTYPEKLNLFKDKSNRSYFESILDYDLEIKQIQASKYHVAILTRQHLYTHGFGTGGRLGHGSEETVFTPKIVQGISGSVSQVAVGPDHTIAITSNGSVWVWGNNKYSQLGITIGAQNQLVPIELPMKKFNAKLAAASKYHSVVVTEGDSIYTWGTNNGQIGHSQPIQIHPRKITSFPIQPILQISCTDNATAFLVKTNAVYVIVNGEYLKVNFPVPEPSLFSRFDKSLKALPVNLSANGNHFVACLTNGEIYMWDPQVKANITKNQIYPKKVVAIGKKNINVKSCSIGVNSSLIVSTMAGHVYIGEVFDKNSKQADTGKALYKFKKINNLEHVTFVCSSIGGSLFALRSDFRCPQKIVEQHSLKKDLICGLDADRTDFDFYFFSVSQEKIKAHQIVLRSRSKFFSKLLSDTLNYSLSLPANATFCFNNHIPNMHLKEFSSTAIKVVLEYFYTGSMTVFWQAEGNLYSYHKDEHIAKLQSEIRKLQALFEINETEFFKSSINSGWKLFFPVIDQANVAVRLKSDVFYCHSLFLSTRCEYFRMILGYESTWHLKADSDGYPTVDLSHIELPIFIEIYHWMTTGTLPVSEEKPVDSELSEWLLYVENILQTANELLLPDIVSIASAILARFVSVYNVLHYLRLSEMHCAYDLEEVCLDFVVRNIETFLRLRLLRNCEDYLIEEIAKKIQQLQLAKLPAILGPNGFYAKLAAEINADGSTKKKPKFTPLTAISTSFKAMSLDNSPAISSNNLSPLLTPLNLPISTSYGSLSKSLDLGKSFISAESNSQTSEWQTPKSKKCVGNSPMKNSFNESILTKKASWSSSVKASPALKAESKYPEITDTFYLDEELAQEEWKTLKSKSTRAQSPVRTSNFTESGKSFEGLNLGRRLSDANGEVEFTLLEQSPISIKFEKKLSQKERKRLGMTKSQSNSLEPSPQIFSPLNSPWKAVPSTAPNRDVVDSKSSWKDMVSLSPVYINTSKIHANFGKSPFQSVSPGLQTKITSPVIIQPKLSQKERKKLNAKNRMLNEDSFNTPAWSGIQSSPAPSLLEIQGQDLTKKESFSNFKEIQLQQELDKKNAIREKTKPLARIQIEESAMEEIKKYYLKTAAGNTGEWIVIKRLPPN
ncbi:hypothetical protein HDV06_003567 [Boothiomyces sp. JEL0866]|nr:hypothetical protein HDV06_003567 [Boothiomyces sp. JEL0866]